MQYKISFHYSIYYFQASKKQKLFLMLWCPDTAKVKKKMLYSSSFDALKKSLVGVQKYIQVRGLSIAKISFVCMCISVLQLLKCYIIANMTKSCGYPVYRKHYLSACPFYSWVFLVL